MLSTLVLFLSSFAADKPFEIQILDDQSGRGVPLVELTTTAGVTFVTDSAGRIAFDEPGMVDQRVWFAVKSHGYEPPKDGFGIAGAAFDVKPGGKGTLKIKRLNIAERLYRITGSGIYRDSILLGHDAPMHKYAIQITIADVRDGALSSSTLKEASSWGKVDTVYEQMVFSEATLAFPLIAGYAYHKGAWKSRKPKKWATLLQTAVAVG